jgi:hypothetical protein
MIPIDSGHILLWDRFYWKNKSQLYVVCDLGIIFKLDYS